MQIVDGSIKSNRTLVSECLLAHILCIAMDNVKNDGDGYEVPSTWVGLLDQDALLPLAKLAPIQQSMLAKMVEKETKTFFARLPMITTWKEATLCIALLIIDLLKDDKINWAGRQHCLISSLIVDEQNNHGDWCKNYSFVIQAAGKARNELNFMGFYN